MSTAVGFVYFNHMLRTFCNCMLTAHPHEPTLHLSSYRTIENSLSTCADTFALNFVGEA